MTLKSVAPRPSRRFAAAGLLPALALGAVAALVLPAAAQTTRQTRPEQQKATNGSQPGDPTAAAVERQLTMLQRTEGPGAVALSPDGQTVAYTVRGKGTATLHVAAVTSPAEAKTVSPEGTCTISDPVWSPDNATLAFLGACTPPSADPTIPRQVQIYLWSAASGSVRQLTHLKGELGQVAWAPDGKALAFLFVENATRSAGALDAMKPWAGVIGEDNIEVQRVYAVGSDTGTGGFLTPADLHVYEFDWAPNSHQIAFVGANPPGENNWWIAQIYREAVTASQTTPPAPVSMVNTRTLTGPLHGLQIAVPRWSPDGKRLAFIGGLMSDQGSTGGDLWVVSANGGTPEDVTPGIKGTPCYETWLNNDALGFVEDKSGHTLLVDWNVRDKSEIEGGEDLGEVTVSGGPIKDAVSVAHTDTPKLAFIKSGFTQPPEVFVLSAAGSTQLTHLHENTKPVAHVESVQWENEGFHVQGWLTFPDNYDPSKKYPLIVEVHGGPSASTGARWGGSLWSGLGYFEFQPNPRGSFGQGEAFTEANRKDFGYGDLRDIEKGMDTVEAKYPIDKHREGLTGWSYGGFMTMFGVTQTHRFRAAVAGAGLSDWLSYYGENSIDQWMIPFFGASVYDDPAVYAKSSAITFIKNVKTPTLVIVGDRDGECPAPQSFEFWHALRDLGVTTQLVVYPDEGHGFRNPEHIRDRARREAEWFAKYMPAE